jgi:hypothetical protein
MQQAENLVYKFSSQQLNICDQGFIECEWICPNSDEPLREVEQELLVDLEKLTQKE